MAWLSSISLGTWLRVGLGALIVALGIGLWVQREQLRTAAAEAVSLRQQRDQARRDADTNAQAAARIQAAADRSAAELGGQLAATRDRAAELQSTLVEIARVPPSTVCADSDGWRVTLDGLRRAAGAAAGAAGHGDASAGGAAALRPGAADPRQ